MLLTNQLEYNFTYITKDILPLFSKICIYSDMVPIITRKVINMLNNVLHTNVVDDNIRTGIIDQLLISIKHKDAQQSDKEYMIRILNTLLPSDLTAPLNNISEDILLELIELLQHDVIDIKLYDIDIRLQITKILASLLPIDTTAKLS